MAEKIETTEQFVDRLSSFAQRCGSLRPGLSKRIHDASLKADRGPSASGQLIHVTALALGALMARRHPETEEMSIEWSRLSIYYHRHLCLECQASKKGSHVG